VGFEYIHSTARGISGSCVCTEGGRRVYVLWTSGCSQDVGPQHINLQNYILWACGECEGSVCHWKQIVFSGSADRSIKVWDLDTFQPISTLNGAHEGEIREMLAMTDHHSGVMTYLLTCSDDCSIKVWNKTFVCEKVLKSHKAPVKALVRSGDFVFSGSDDSHIIVWNVLNFTEVAVIAGLVGVSSLAIWNITTPPSLLSGHVDGTIKVWNLANIKSPECQMLLTSHNEPVRALLAASNIFFSGGYDKSIKVWYPQHQRLEYIIH